MHRREQFLHQLLGGDRAAELLALLGVAQADLERLAGQARRTGGQREPAVVEGGQRDLHAAADLAEDGVVADAHALEHDLGGVAGAQAELAVDGPAGVAGAVLGDQEAGDAAVLAVDDRAGEHLGDRTAAAVGDEHLASRR